MISVTNRHAHVTESSEILDQYPNLYRECSSENFDYYGITDETSCGVSRETICPLCKLGHNDEEIEDFGFPYDPELANIGQKQIMTVQIPRIVQLIKSWKALC
ncbi:unnamed protein product [Rhizophagus irregularis]|nr:unnamed protein product [Rhizophagus irregularis]